MAAAAPTSTHSDRALPATAGPVDRALAQLAVRLEEVLAEEQALVSAGDFSGLDGLIERKSILALDLTRFAQQRCQGINESSRRRMREIRTILDENALLLRQHIEAVAETSRIIANSMRSAASDGTYSSDAAPRRCKP